MNFYIRERSLDLSSCGICKTKPCVFNCRNCEQYLCRPCKATHDALADNNNHVIFTSDGHSGNKIAQKTYCKIHRRQEVRVFCNDCTVAVCQICLERNHSSHFTSDLMEYLNEVGNELDINRTYMEDKLTQLKTDVNNINKSIRETRQNSNTECDKIDEHVELFYNILKHSRKGMKQDLKKIQDDYEDKMGKHKDGKEMMIKKLENCLNATTKDLKNPSIDKMLTIARYVKSTKESITDTVDSDVSMPSLRLCKYQSGQLDGDTVSRVMGGLVYIHEFWANINGGGIARLVAYHRRNYFEKLSKSINFREAIVNIFVVTIIFMLLLFFGLTFLLFIMQQIHDLLSYIVLSMEATRYTEKF
ncbi:hypothetical protein SNE40_017443 [Patella caerulea]